MVSNADGVAYVLLEYPGVPLVLSTCPPVLEICVVLAEEVAVWMADPLQLETVAKSNAIGSVDVVVIARALLVLDRLTWTAVVESVVARVVLVGIEAEVAEVSVKAAPPELFEDPGDRSGGIVVPNNCSRLLVLDIGIPREALVLARPVEPELVTASTATSGLVVLEEYSTLLVLETVVLRDSAELVGAETAKAMELVMLGEGPTMLVLAGSLVAVGPIMLAAAVLEAVVLRDSLVLVGSAEV